MRTSRPVWSTSLFALLALSAICWTVGCTKPDEPESTPTGGTDPNVRLARDYARRLAATAHALDESGELGQTQLIEFDDAWAVIAMVKADLRAGRQDAIAQVVLQRADWAKALWYEYAEIGFADAWRLRSVPLVTAASTDTITALKQVARDGRSRRARVAAAAALVMDEPELAKETLLREYADFHLDPMDRLMLTPTSRPLATTDYLRALGVIIPDEVTSTFAADRMRARIGGRGTGIDHDELCAAAGDLFNQKLRTTLADGGPEALRRYLTTDGRSSLFAECWKQAPQELKRRQEEFRKSGETPWTRGDADDSIWGTANDENKPRQDPPPSLP